MVLGNYERREFVMLSAEAECKLWSSEEEVIEYPSWSGRTLKGVDLLSYVIQSIN